MNDGDWVESCTALVETHEGIWKIIHWTKEKDDDNESFDRTASHMAGEYVSYEDEITTHEKQQEWLKNVRKTEY
jgi:hypothetical protein